MPPEKKPATRLSIARATESWESKCDLSMGKLAMPDIGAAAAAPQCIADASVPLPLITGFFKILGHFSHGKSRVHCTK